MITLFIAALYAIVLKTAGLFYGQQFQSPAFLMVMVYFVVALALSMLGVWTLNPPQALYAAEGKAPHTGYLGSFTNGLMATLLATPCSAPYLGPALGVRTAGMADVMLTLGLVGVGMSAEAVSAAGNVSGGAGKNSARRAVVRSAQAGAGDCHARRCDLSGDADSERDIMVVGADGRGAGGIGVLGLGTDADLQHGAGGDLADSRGGAGDRGGHRGFAVFSGGALFWRGAYNRRQWIRAGWKPFNVSAAG